jgi:hypothetical protein
MMAEIKSVVLIEPKNSAKNIFISCVNSRGLIDRLHKNQFFGICNPTQSALKTCEVYLSLNKPLMRKAT